VFGWTLLALVLLILATLTGALCVLQTGCGKREIASLASGTLSGRTRLTLTRDPSSGAAPGDSQKATPEKPS
jgi:hypothetical protein